VSDPDLYIASMAAVLSRFPERVVRAVCDPGTGLQTRQKWLPRQSEVREACEAALAEEAYRDRRTMLSRHGALRHGPSGLEPLADEQLTPQEARDRAVARWENEVRPSMQRTEPRPGDPPPGLTDDQLREWHCGQLKRLAARAGNTVTDADIAALPDL
jgi:hypothetical protein